MAARKCSTIRTVAIHELRLGRADRRVRVELNVLNLFNQKTSRHRFNYLNRARAAAEINLANTDLSKGYDYRAMINATTEGRAGTAYEPRFGMDDLFNDGTRAHFMVKYLF